MSRQRKVEKGYLKRGVRCERFHRTLFVVLKTLSLGFYRTERGFDRTSSGRSPISGYSFKAPSGEYDPHCSKSLWSLVCSEKLLETTCRTWLWCTLRFRSILELGKQWPNNAGLSPPWRPFPGSSSLPHQTTPPPNCPLRLPPLNLSCPPFQTLPIPTPPLSAPTLPDLGGLKVE